jgi:hypothetical protein
MNPAGIDPKWVFYLGILVTIQTAIGQGAVPLTNMMPEVWIPFVKGWSQFLGRPARPLPAVMDQGELGSAAPRTASPARCATR